MAKNDLTFKVTTHNFKVIFCGVTSAGTADFSDIPLNNFMFTSFEDLLVVNFRPETLVGNLLLVSFYALLIAI